MEMYADVDGRGGVLEPEGIVSIKYRQEKQLETMARLDPLYGELHRRSLEKDLGKEDLQVIKAKMAERVETLKPVYLQIALQFADLHDRAGRMEAKGTIRHPLQWKMARRFFYWRLRRRLSEEVLLKRMASATSAGSSTNCKSSTMSMQMKEENLGLLKAWSGLLNKEFEHEDRKVAEYYEGKRKEIYGKIDGMKTEGVAKKVADLMMGNKEGGLKGVRDALSMVSTAEREEVLKWLMKG